MAEFSQQDRPPVPAHYEEVEERERAEKAVAWLKAILRQTNENMVTVESLEKALKNVPEEEVCDILNKKVRMLISQLYIFDGGEERVKHNEAAVQVYLAFVDASSAMTPREFSSVEYLHHELAYCFSQLAMIKPQNAGGALTLAHLENLKRKFEAAAKDFAAAEEFMATKVEVEAVENAGLAEEHGRLLGLLKGHENKLEAKELTVNEVEQIEELQGSLSDILLGEEPIAKLNEVLRQLRELGQDVAILEVLGWMVRGVEVVNHEQLETYDQEQVRYYTESLQKQLVIVERLTGLMPAEEVLVASWKRMLELKLPALEEKISFFDHDPASIVENKVNNFTRELDDCLHEPMKSSFEAFQEAVIGLHDSSAGEKVLEFLKSEIEYGTDLLSEHDDLEYIEKFLEKSYILHNWLEESESFLTPVEKILVEKLKTALLIKAENARELLAKMDGSAEKELSVEHEKLLGLLKRHEGGLEKKLASEEVRESIEAEVQKLQGRLYLYMAHVDAVGVGKAIAALNKLGKSDLVISELRKIKTKNTYSHEQSHSQVAALHALGDVLNNEQMDFVDSWDEGLRLAEEKIKAGSTAAELDEMRLQKEKDIRRMSGKFQSALIGDGGEHVGYASSWLLSLHQFGAQEEALRLLNNEVVWRLDKAQEYAMTGELEEIDDWLKHRQHLLEVFKVIDSIVTNDERASITLYQKKSVERVAQLEARREFLLQPEKKLLKAAVKVLPAKADTGAVVMTREQLVGRLSVGDFGYLKPVLEKEYGKRWFEDSELKEAAQISIDKQWNTKPLMRPVLARFIKEFELKTPVEPKPVRKSRS
jgi:hypothetical protein